MNWRPAQLEVGARSETGYVRDENQDRMSGTRVPLGYLYIVADGMGGHKGGAMAAELAVQELQRSIADAPVDAAVEKVIQTAFNKANDTVYQRSHAGDPTVEGMGSTAVLLLISGRVARVAHVGDSRAYLYRRGRLKQLTTDHTVVQKMVQAGMLKPNEAADHPNASVLDRAIGSKPNVLVDISEPWRLREGDAILLCSDGLSGYVLDAEVAAVLRSDAAVQEIPDRLMQLALQKGGEDNITIQFVQYGTRPETHRRAPGFLPPLFQMIAVFALGAMLSAVTLALYLPGGESDFKTKESTLIETFRQTEEELKKTKLQLDHVQSEQGTQLETSEKRARALKEMARMVDDIDQKISGISNKLNEEKEINRQQQRITQSQPGRAREERTTVKNTRQDVGQELASVKEVLQKARAILEANPLAQESTKLAGVPDPKPTFEPDTVPTEPASGGEQSPGH